ncbi:hypothetical protein FE810_11475 [Thalassotalea litorea]|uniref:Uncharacterized protein n=1 Tax=Thalassotalea litorea TaxID=2020715 RepID=A0A5R9IGQ1_9GAMM|nr:hypothetical protein [Thalassotalea litorea]TLU64695.1 hypothetical protein FE810_11475 [Thalassotalea litorea]
MKKLLLLTAFSSMATSAPYDAIERNAISSAFDALQAFQVLTYVAKQCRQEGEVEYAPKTDLDSLIHNKLHINLDELERLALTREAYLQSYQYQISDIECSLIRVAEYYDDYDMAKFNFELYQPISRPLAVSDE